MFYPSTVIDLNQNGQLDSAITKSDSHQDMSTTDSGIVSTEPRRTDFTAQVCIYLCLFLNKTLTPPFMRT